MKKSYTKPTAEVIALHAESMLADSEVKSHTEDVGGAKYFGEEDGEIEWD